MVRRRTTVSASIDIELLEKLEEISAKTRRSISSIRREAVEQYVRGRK